MSDQSEINNSESHEIPSDNNDNNIVNNISSALQGFKLPVDDITDIQTSIEKINDYMSINCNKVNELFHNLEAVETNISSVTNTTVELHNKVALLEEQSSSLNLQIDKRLNDSAEVTKHSLDTYFTNTNQVINQLTQRVYALENELSMLKMNTSPMIMQSLTQTPVQQVTQVQQTVVTETPLNNTSRIVQPIFRGL
jgi:chromosome segregation ATPase